MTTTVPASSVLIPSIEELSASTPYVPGEFKVYPMAKRPGITVMVIVFDARVELPDHIANGPITIQTLSGHVDVNAEGKTVELPTGGLMHIDARVEHALKAGVKSRVLLTLFELNPEAEPAVPGIIKKATAAPVADPANLIPVQDVSSHGAHNGHDGGCGCGEENEALPELDVRTIPHAIRHATVFGALQGLRPQTAMILIAHHNPLPLLAQIEQMFSGGVEVTYLQEGPEEWKLRMYRAF